MRRVARLLIAMTAMASLWSVAPSAHAMTCSTNDEVIPPAVGDAVCTVVLTAVRPVCSKFPCG